MHSSTDIKIIGVHRLLTLALVLALTSGCSGGVTSGHAGQAVVGSEVGAAVPQLPETAERHTAKGAVAFAGYYYKLIARAITGGDWRPAFQSTDPACRDCARYLRGMRVPHLPAGALRAEHLVVDSAVLLRHHEFPNAEFGVDVAVHSDFVYSAPGLATRTISVGGEAHPYVWVAWRLGKWIVMGFSAGP
jgi:hypothetical protein